MPRLAKFGLKVCRCAETGRSLGTRALPGSQQRRAERFDRTVVDAFLEAVAPAGADATAAAVDQLQADHAERRPCYSSLSSASSTRRSGDARSSRRANRRTDWLRAVSSARMRPWAIWSASGSRSVSLSGRIPHR